MLPLNPSAAAKRATRAITAKEACRRKSIARRYPALPATSANGNRHNVIVH